MNLDKKHGFRTQVLQLIDAVIVLVAFVIALWIWNNSLLSILDDIGWFRIDSGKITSLVTILPVLYLLVPFVPISLELSGFYRRSGSAKKINSLLRVIQAHVAVFVIFTVLAVILKLAPHRPTFAIGMITSIMLIWFRECGLQYLNKYKHSKGAGKLRILIAANEKNAELWWGGLDDSQKLNFKNVGRFSPDTDTLEDLRSILSETAAERVVFIANQISFEKVSKAIEECEIQGVDVWLAADFVRARICKPTFDYMGSQPMLVLSSTPSHSWSLLAKDILDRILSFTLIILTLPLWLLAYIGIKIQSPGPVIYKQERAGRYGHPFKIWKFRTMVMDADKKLEALKKEQGNQMSGPVFKLDQDPRIFSFGQFMRKYSIDELPQLINVLKGEMSLVGPRPMAMYELPEIEKSEHRRKLSVKPGITCIWQVSGRNSITDFDEWVQLDLKYIDNWSFWLDIKLLLLTLPAVLFARGSK